MNEPTAPAAKPKCKYTMTEAALDQRRAAAKLSTGPVTEEGKAIVSRNGWKHCAYSALAKRQFDNGLASMARAFARPCRTTCPVHPDNPERTEAPCSLVTSGKTRAGGNCLDKMVYHDAFEAIEHALRGVDTDGADALLASEVAAAVQMLHDMRSQLADSSYIITIPQVDKDGDVITMPDGSIAPAKVLAHPLMPHIWRALEILGINFAELNVTPRARAKAKSDGETAGALQTAMGAIFQRLGPLRRIPAPDPGGGE